jgi:predicted RecB family endonuclease
MDHGIFQRVTPASTDLPDLNTLDSETLKALLLEKHAVIIQQNAALVEQQATITSRNHEIENLKLLILKLKRMKFGRSSEKLDRQIEQLELRLEDLETAEAAAEPGPSSEAETTSRRRKGSRGPSAVALTARNADTRPKAQRVSGLWWCAQRTR